MAEKRLPFGRVETPAYTPAGGTASPTDIMGAAFDQTWFVENTTAANDSLVEAYETLRRDVKTATGVDLGNPMVAAPQTPSLFPNVVEGIGRQYGQGDVIAEQRLGFQQKLNELAAQYPREAVKDWAQRDPVQDAQRIARLSDEKLAQMMESRPGWDGYVYQFLGAAGASMRDPVTIGSLFVGGGPGGARTALGRILQTAGGEAVANAATEAVMQPWVQSWRQQAGLDSGLDQAIANVGFAALFGGVLGAAGRTVAEGVSFARMTPEQRGRLAPEVRGAIDAGNSMADIEAQRPPDVAPQTHETMLARAEAAVQREPVQTPPVLDDVQVSRIVEALAPERTDGVVPAPETFRQTLEAIRNTADATAAPPAPRPVMEFIRSIGGVAPDSPIATELAAMGITNRDLPGLFKRGGHTDLDNIPASEAAPAFPGRTDIEDGNGYVSRQAFLDALQQEKARTLDVGTARADERAHWEKQGINFETMDDAEILARMARASDAESRWHDAGPEARLETDGLVREALRLAGGAAPDAVIRAAVDLHRMEGEGLGTAVEWAMSDAAGVSRALPPVANEFEALGSRPPGPLEPTADPDLDWGADMNALAEWAEAEGLGDLAVPFGDSLATAEDIRAALERSSTLERVVNDCPF